MKALGIIKYTFSFIGLAFLVGAVFAYENTSRFLAHAMRTEGTVIALRPSHSNNSTTYAPVVEYSGESGVKMTFTSSMSSSPPSYSVGEKVEVLYLPTDLTDARINGYMSLWGVSTIIGVLGSVFFLIGAAMFIFPLLQGRKEENLRAQGTAIETDFQSVELNTCMRVNGRHPFRILTQWQNPMTSEIHVFHSQNLWFDPTNYITRKRITVFIEKNNPRKYFVDLSFLPKLAPGNR